MRVPTYDEALQLVNDNPYGNGTAIFTRDGGVARQFQFEVNVGMVGINVPIPVPVAYYSFGGWKSSLFGDSHIYGPGGDPLLHARQGRHEPLARPGHEQGRPGLPPDALTRHNPRRCGGRHAALPPPALSFTLRAAPRAPGRALCLMLMRPRSGHLAGCVRGRNPRERVP